MKKSITGKVGVVLAATMLAAYAIGTCAAEDSGFLRDYSNLEETKDAQGRIIYRSWVSTKLTPAKYDAVLLDPIVYYPEPRPTDQISAETLQEILAYSNDLHKRSVANRFRVVDRAGPGVVRIRTAFTAVAAKAKA